MNDALGTVAAAIELAARMKLLYESMRQTAQQTHALTEEESAALDARAKLIFESPESQPSGR